MSDCKNSGDGLWVLSVEVVEGKLESERDERSTFYLIEQRASKSRYPTSLDIHVAFARSVRPLPGRRRTRPVLVHTWFTQ